MGALELRESVLESINSADERLLIAVKAAIESHQENEIVAYSIDGTSITKAAYKQELLNAKKEFSNGHCISQEDLENESKKW